MLSALANCARHGLEFVRQSGILASAAALVEQPARPDGLFNFSDGHDGVAFNPAFVLVRAKIASAELVCCQNPLLLHKLASPATDTDEDRTFPLAGRLDRGACRRKFHRRVAARVARATAESRRRFSAVRGRIPTRCSSPSRAGSAGLNHGHMDAGSFVLDAGGVRWACDLGAQGLLFH